MPTASRGSSGISYRRAITRGHQGDYMTYTELSLLITAIANSLGSIAALIRARRR